MPVSRTTPNQWAVLALCPAQKWPNCKAIVWD
jgi:hypothetical protein